MRLLVQQLIRLTLWRQRSGQDLIEYALMAVFVAVSAGAVMPGFASMICQIFSKAASVLVKANAS
jgi:Flp pilus assembly pilin Flp